ncbi:MAG: flagellar motor switch protein FliN [Ignavibacteriaceae bacterium]|nr:flagellar motor switch protein FliN [Ignavibacterium sp.]MCC6255368.1 flagellar motor switch protein FliN [Ignavibacteriaceae bacterium]HRN25680.1 flagellar motor switch protein FliN [Ignavibacteriaceae bacterium]HRP91733.1 flagellar motor switch protein FliN [Ignavibacteriaceae bacterium]HRQ53298.1 flagellar motor switch protein FliN [Ignavibacteriaceae bacterium]
MEEALKQGEESLKDFESSNKDNKKGKVKSISEAELPEFEESRFSGNDSMEKLNFLKDLQLSIYIELGRTQMQIKEILELERGYVIELDKLASEPVDIFVNNKKIAEGEVVVIDKHFGIRIVNLVDVSSRMKAI